MPFILWDISTDDVIDGNYDITKENFDILDLSTDLDDIDAPTVKGLALCFKNNLNENPI